MKMFKIWIICCRQNYWIFCCCLFWLSLLSTVVSTEERSPVILRSPTNISAFVDKSQNLTCVVDGIPKPAVIFQKREDVGNRWQQLYEGQRYRLKKYGVLVIKRLISADSGFYRCTAENSVDTKYSEAAYLNVQAKVTIVTPPAGQKVNWGTQVELFCEVVAVPFPYRWWTKNGQKIIDPETEKVFSGPRLPFVATETATYECLAENTHSQGYSNVSSKAIVTVIDGFCANYAGIVCNENLGKKIVYKKWSLTPDLLEDSILRIEKEIESTAPSCLRRGAHQLFCRHAFPECIVPADKTDEAKPKLLCRETCLAVKELFCSSVDWSTFDEGTLTSLVPDCDRLPSRHDHNCTFVDLFNNTDEETTSCYNGVGENYVGRVNVTESGHQCQAWSEQLPHRHNRFPSVYPILEDAGNACRNTGGEKERPWCFTMNASVRWQYCNISFCDEENATASELNAGGFFNIEIGFILATVIAIPSTFLVLLIVVCLRFVTPAVRNAFKTTNQKQRQEEEDEEGRRRNVEKEDFDINLLPPVVCARPHNDTAIDRLEYPRRNSIVHRRDIAESAFGRVFQAEVPRIVEGQDVVTTVVVKMLKLDATPAMQQDFCREASLLAGLDHSNVVKVIGVCFVGRPQCIILELMRHGDLNEFLQNSVPAERFADRRRRSGESFDRDGNVSRLTCFDQLRIAEQIADAMVYVSARGYVHRDLATRNCLVGDRLTVKISDFGLAVLLRSDQDYHQGDELVPIPIRWLPPESIIYNHFSHASDAWSFGVVFWEIFSFGSLPYGGMTLEDVIKYVREGSVLCCPDDASNDAYELMQLCWNPNPTSRPDFVTIRDRLRKLKEREMNCDECCSVASE